MLEIDHVLIAVEDLDAAARAFEVQTGLRSVPGGRHEAWGTANRIVPLGATYLELIAVVDPAVAATATVGRWVAAAPWNRPMGWVVRTDDVAAVARRLHLQPAEGSRTTPDGRLLRWRTAGIERAAREPSLPFFIEWGEGTPHPGAERLGPGDADAPHQLVRAEVSGDAARLDAWLGGERVRVVVEPGPPAVRAVVLAADGTELRI
jgi:hypothetical protein